MMDQSVGQISEEFKACDVTQLPSFIAIYGSDERSGVKALVKRANKKLADLEAEKQRLALMRTFEERYSDRYSLICGVDEAGRGPFAGPVVAGAVILPQDAEIFGLNDSKKLSPQKREELFEIINETAVSYGVGRVPAERIDEIGVGAADFEAMRIAIGQLSPAADFALTDAFKIPDLDLPQCPIVKGDAKSVSIAAASIMAKVTRDRMMDEYDKIYPQYGFKEHKGYGTAYHREMITKYGPCEIHRMSFLGNMNKSWEK